jgi:hypothetical protein
MIQGTIVAKTHRLNSAPVPDENLYAPLALTIFRTENCSKLPKLKPADQFFSSVL